MNKIIVGDCLIKLKELEDNSIDSIVCDPPYELGFMGKSWDNTGIANNKEMWAECLRVLKPGGHLLAFSGTRTYHRMASAIEDAGFEVRDMIEWVYSTGFPKSLNIGKAVDKRGGTTSDQSKEFAEYIKNKRNKLNITLSKADEVICGGTTNYSWFEGRPAGQRLPRKSDYLKMKEFLQLDDRYDNFMEETEREFLGKYETDMGGLGGERLGMSGGNITKGTSEWEGWGTALKPAHEPICMARKPLAEKTVAENCLKWGTGGINIDGSRVAHQSEADRLSATPQGKVIRNNFAPGEGVEGTETNRPDTSLGRFPANLIHDNSEEVRECFPETAKGSDKPRNRNTIGSFGMPNDTTPEYADSGNASRFFKSIKEDDPLQEWAENEIKEHREEIIEEIKKEYGIIKGKSIIYQAKASKSERNKGCEGLEEKDKYKLDNSGNSHEIHSKKNKRVNPQTGELEERKETDGLSKNNHPTVKPIALMEYLIKMVTPKGGIVLDPFAGSGSTLVAAKQNGYQYIGIEMTEEYIPIIEARLNAIISINETKK